MMNGAKKQEPVLWLVGARIDSQDRMLDFVKNGYWKHERNDKYTIDNVNDVQVSDCIAIKSTFTQRHNLPFDNRENNVSVMSIKAIGTVIENPCDGRTLKVDWKLLDSPRFWYLNTYRYTIQKITPIDWMKESLMDFVLNETAQDIDRFRNDPYWIARFGDKRDKAKFPWTIFYEKVADSLLQYKNKRPELLAWIKSIAAKHEKLNYLQGAFPVGDICPFTVLGMFNRAVKIDTRRAIAKDLADFLRVDIPVPESFDGVPLLPANNSCFFSFQLEKQDPDIENLWKIFELAISLADSDGNENSESFSNLYDVVSNQKQVGWNLTMGLFWIRPWDFMTLDDPSQRYVENELKVKISKNGSARRCNGEDYLTVLDQLGAKFQTEHCPVHSFPELSLIAFKGNEDVDETENEVLKMHNTAKNIILYGPPGTGKTYSLMERALRIIDGEKAGDYSRKDMMTRYRQCLDDGQIAFVTFHQSFSYEDFIQGIRPISSGEGIKYELKDGVLKQIADRAMNNWKYSGQDEREDMDQLFTFTHAVNRLKDYLSRNETIKIKLAGGKEHDASLSSDGKALEVTPGKNTYRLTFDFLKSMWLSETPIRNYSDISHGLNLYLFPAFNLLKTFDDGEGAQENLSEDFQQYVLIIDEINRGNVSKIFGETITLLEPTKRLGEEDETSVILPYSNEDARFVLPPNLHVIGTMNTADRSIALLDTALRRRFEFVEMMPDASQLGAIKCGKSEVNLGAVLKALNDRIEVIYDRDHLIGHAYLMEANNQRTVINAFKLRIIPLLQEYFYGDWEKIRWVLGDTDDNANEIQGNPTFIEEITNNAVSFKGMTKNIFKLKDDDGIWKAIKRLSGKTIAQEAVDDTQADT